MRIVFHILAVLYDCNIAYLQISLRRFLQVFFAFFRCYVLSCLTSRLPERKTVRDEKSKSFFRNVLLTVFPRLNDRGKHKSLGKRGKSDEAQLEDKCFKSTADRRSGHLQKCQYQGAFPAIPVRQQTESDHPDSR